MPCLPVTPACLCPACPCCACLCLAAGYFDVRDLQERWVRVWMRRGMMLVLPEGIYHRFTLDQDNYIKVRVGGWVPVGAGGCRWVGVGAGGRLLAVGFAAGPTGAACLPARLPAHGLPACPGSG